MQDAKDTFQELERTRIEHVIDEDDNPDQSHRTETWLDAFQSQLTEKVSERVRRFARPRALNVAYAGRKVDDYYVRELVQDAIGDTWEGRLTWDPARVTLENHLIRAVQCRTKDHRKHQIAFPHDALDDQTDQSKNAESEASSRVSVDTRYAETRTYSKEVMTQIRTQAGSDKPVHRIIDAYDAGARTKAEILEHVRMKARTYNNAQLRLKRIIRNLTNQKLATQMRA